MTNGLHLPKHQRGPRSTSRAAPLHPYPGKGAAKPRMREARGAAKPGMREAARCPPIPLPAAAPSPTGSPRTQAHARLPAGGGGEGGGQPQLQERGRDAERPCMAALCPRARARVGEARRQGRAQHPRRWGRGDAAPRGGCQGREAGERRGAWLAFRLRRNLCYFHRARGR